MLDKYLTTANAEIGHVGNLPKVKQVGHVGNLPKVGLLVELGLEISSLDYMRKRSHVRVHVCIHIYSLKHVSCLMGKYVFKKTIPNTHCLGFILID